MRPSRSRRLLASALAAVTLAACGGPDTTTDVAAADDDAAPTGTFHARLDHLDVSSVTLERSTDGASTEVAVVVPTTGEQFRRGLMEVPELADGTGMLFDFRSERTGTFWMKDTLVPLDIAFASGDGEILVVLGMEPCDADPCPSYDPGVRYRYALEVPRGWFAANDLGPGDRLRVPADGTAAG